MIYHHTVKAVVEVSKHYEVEVVVDSIDSEPDPDTVKNAILNAHHKKDSCEVDTQTHIYDYELVNTDVSGGVE